MVSSKNGFSLVELLVVVGIFTVVAALAFPALNNWQASSRSGSTEAELRQAINFARYSSLSGKNNSSFGVFFNLNESGPDSATIYQGDSYASRSSEYDRVIVWDDSIEVAAALGANEINFSVFSGNPSATGTLNITPRNGGASAEIVINNLGFIE